MDTRKLDLAEDPERSLWPYALVGSLALNAVIAVVLVPERYLPFRLQFWDEPQEVTAAEPAPGEVQAQPKAPPTAVETQPPSSSPSAADLNAAARALEALPGTKPAPPRKARHKAPVRTIVAAPPAAAGPSMAALDSAARALQALPRTNPAPPPAARARPEAPTESAAPPAPPATSAVPARPAPNVAPPHPQLVLGPFRLTIPSWSPLPSAMLGAPRGSEDARAGDALSGR